jgi:hypothetical protein
LALAIAAVYTAVAATVSLWDLLRPEPPGSWLFLRGIETCIATLPACYLVENAFPAVGIPSPNFYHIRESAYTVAALILMILSCAALIYFLASWIERRIRFRKRKGLNPPGN